MRYGAFLTIGVNGKSHVLRRLRVGHSAAYQQEVLRFCGCGHAGALLQPRRCGSGMEAPTFQTSLLPSGTQAVIPAIKHDNENLELDFSLTCCAAAFSQSVACVLFHPENLGSVTFTQPASIWDFAETWDLLDWEGTFTGAAYSCDLYSHDMPKPSRFLSNIEHLRTPALGMLARTSRARRSPSPLGTIST